MGEYILQPSSSTLGIVNEILYSIGGETILAQGVQLSNGIFRI
jgi:hypothetical protein